MRSSASSSELVGLALVSGAGCDEFIMPKEGGSRENEAWYNSREDRTFAAGD
jgi:hypothetical protein